MGFAFGTILEQTLCIPLDDILYDLNESMNVGHLWHRIFPPKNFEELEVNIIRICFIVYSDCIKKKSPHAVCRGDEKMMATHRIRPFLR